MQPCVRTLVIVAIDAKDDLEDSLDQQDLNF